MSIFVLSDTRELNALLKQRLASEINKHGNSIAYVSSSPQDAERRYFHTTEAEYALVSPGATLEYFDLSDAFSDEHLRKMLSHGVIHLSGGNTYAFLDAIRKRNLIDTISKHLDRNGLVIGVSAGAIVLGPHIGTAALCGDTNQAGIYDLRGLDLVDFCFMPHLGTHYQYTSENQDRVRAFAAGIGKKVYIGADPDGIFVSDGGPELLGNSIKTVPSYWIM